MPTTETMIRRYNEDRRINSIMSLEKFLAVCDRKRAEAKENS